MKTGALMVVVALAACSGPRHVGRTAPLAPGPVISAVDPAREERQFAAADNSPPVAPPAGAATGEVGFKVAWRSVTTVVEEPAASPAPVPDPARAPLTWQQLPVDDGYWREHHYHEPRFPVGTAIGTGIGYAIGSHHGDSCYGAWLGGSIGLLFDLHRY